MANSCLVEAQIISQWQKETAQTRVFMRFFLPETLLTSIKERRIISTQNWHKTYRLSGTTFVETAVFVQLRRPPLRTLVALDRARGTGYNRKIWDKINKIHCFTEWITTAALFHNFIKYTAQQFPRHVSIPTLRQSNWLSFSNRITRILQMCPPQ